MHRPTIKDIARECGVSLSTVSLVLNDNPRISQKTRDKVMESVKKNGYYPNTQARGLAAKSSMTISVVVPQLTHVFADIYFGEIISGVYDRALEDNYKMLLEVANTRFIKEREYIKLLESRRADGLLFIASSRDDEYLKDFENTSYKFLLVNHLFPGSNLNYLTVDYEDSARQVADHLVSLGHRKIGIIVGTNTNTGLSYRDSFVSRCKSHGLKQEGLVEVDGGPYWSEEGGVTSAEKLLAADSGITAMVAANDRLAIGAMSHLRSKGLRVPEDISVVGADDIPAATFSTPSLTSVHHHLYHLGRRACDNLLKLIKGEISSCQDIMPVLLMDRDSTGPAPKD